MEKHPQGRSGKRMRVCPLFGVRCHPPRSKSSFQDGDGGGVEVGMAEAEVQGAGVHLLEQKFAGVVEDDVGLAGFFAADFHVLPAKLAADAGAEGFGDGFLGGEASGEKGGRFLVGKAVRDFFGAEDALQKAFAEFFVRGANAFDFDDVNADAEDHHGDGSAGTPRPTILMPTPRIIWRRGATFL